MSEIIFGFDQNKVVNLQPIDKGWIYHKVDIEGLAMLYSIKRLYDAYDKDKDGYLTIHHQDIYKVMPILDRLTSAASKTLLNTLIAFGLIEIEKVHYNIWNWIIRVRPSSNFIAYCLIYPRTGCLRA